MRFRSADPDAPVDQLGTLDAKFIRNTFIDNELVAADTVVSNSICSGLLYSSLPGEHLEHSHMLTHLMSCYRTIDPSLTFTLLEN